MSQGNDDLVSRLRHWGHATVVRHARKMDGHSAGDHILAKHKDLAPGTKEKAERLLVERCGVSRRLRMAQSAGGSMVGMTIAPLWSCDPIPAKNDADRPHDNPTSWVDVGLPDDLLPVDRAIRHLERQENGRLRWMIVREEYTGTGTQRMKCARVAQAYGGKLTLRQYRQELYRAQDWLRGRIVI